jgi:hypothetical protein
VTVELAEMLLCLAGFVAHPTRGTCHGTRTTFARIREFGLTDCLDAHRGNGPLAGCGCVDGPALGTSKPCSIRSAAALAK